MIVVEHEAFVAAFRELYAYGMELIDTARDYFSGEGRPAARLLGHERRQSFMPARSNG